MTPKSLVIGASGFLGSHVARRLVAQGTDVRVMIRETSSTRGIDGLDVDRRYGDIFDEEAVRTAMGGCDVVYYCVVDARAYLRDAKTLWHTNVDGLRVVLNVAAESNELKRFVFTSSISTIGRVDHGLATEETQHNWLDRAGEYVRTRVAAENLVLEYARDKGVPAVAMCVANTYGAGDWLPTPHGKFVADAVRGKLPFYIDGYEAEVVGIDDAADALILAAEHGCVGERYIVSERFMSVRDILTTACRAVDIDPPKRKLPIGVLAAMSYPSDWMARLRHRETELRPICVRLMRIMSPMSHAKAVDELGWQPRPTMDSIVEAARFFVSPQFRSPEAKSK